jgi:hypothetical protein
VEVEKVLHEKEQEYLAENPIPKITREQLQEK